MSRVGGENSLVNSLGQTKLTNSLGKHAHDQVVHLETAENLCIVVPGSRENNLVASH